MKHPIPKWTWIVTPLALLIMLTTPWTDLTARYPDAAPLMLIGIAIGNALVLISISHWVKGAKK